MLIRAGTLEESETASALYEAFRGYSENCLVCGDEAHLGAVLVTGTFDFNVVAANLLKIKAAASQRNPVPDLQ